MSDITKEQVIANFFNMSLGIGGSVFLAGAYLNHSILALVAGVVLVGAGGYRIVTGNK